MMRKILIIAALLALASCASVRPVCDGPRDGGIGGTGGCMAAEFAI